MAALNLSGILPPLTSPFNDRGDLDLEALARNLEHYNRAGLAGYVAFGSNGEAPLFSVNYFFRSATIIFAGQHASCFVDRRGNRRRSDSWQDGRLPGSETTNFSPLPRHSPGDTGAEGVSRPQRPRP